MAWTAPMTAVANAVFTAAQFNTHVRDNLLETSPAKATTPGSYFVADAANSIAERTVNSATVATSQGTSSTTFVDLTTAGPSVTVNTGTSALVCMTAQITDTVASVGGIVGVDVSGASTVAASTAVSLRLESDATAEFNRATSVAHLTGLTAGSNTFKLQYRAASASTVNFADRNIIVLPL